MTLEMAVDIIRNLLQTGLILAIPILGTATVVGLDWLHTVYNEFAGADLLSFPN